MLTYETAYGPVHVVETDQDVPRFMGWIKAQQTVAIDTETTGLDIFSPGFRVRLVQFGSRSEAYVVPAERFSDLVRNAMDALHRSMAQLIMHNATYDLLALAQADLAYMDRTYPDVLDTRVMAHIIDPRGKQDGGVGHGLKALSAVYVDDNAPDGQTAIQAAFKANGWDWSTIPLDHPDYVTYAGLDVILTAQLFAVLSKILTSDDEVRLVDFEMRVQAACARMQRRGLKIDVPYAESLLPYYDELAADGRHRAAEWGVENVNSTKQVADVLGALGAHLVETTPSGAVKVDKQVLAAVISNGGPAAAVAQAVQDAKQAGKFRGTYVEACLDWRDSDDRIHPWINSLQARTARMSIGTPPLQQLPSGDFRLRRMFVADPGQHIISVDYSQIELRVLAVLADERIMLDAINAGEDLHDTTATRLFGDTFTKAQRKLAKNVGFGRVYGGGATTLARQAGVDIPTAEAAMAGYDVAFPGIKRYSNRLVERARNGVPEVVTPAGRHLPLDRWRLYSATNYMVQSTARDVLANALLELEAAGLGDHLLLPVHDEVLAQASKSEAGDVAAEIARVMTVPFGSVKLTAEAEVYGASWGHGYGAQE